jgi:hypothetical protein
MKEVMKRLDPVKRARNFLEPLHHVEKVCQSPLHPGGGHED